MRIAQFVNTLALGGAERVAVDLAVSLSSRGHQVSVLALHGSGELEAPLRAAGVEVLALEKGTGFKLGPLRALPRFLKERRIEVLHSHNTHLHHLAAGAARLAKVRTVVNTVHGLVNVPDTTRERLLYQGAAFWTDRVVGVCQPVAAAMREELLLPERLVKVVYNGIDPSPFLELMPVLQRDRVVFGNVGRLVEVKNHAALVHAFAKVHREHPGARLRILGYGEREEAVRALVRDLGLGEAVDLVAGNSPVPGFLETIDVFVLSSRSEGLPISLLEAMAAGRPVIGPRVGGIPEVIAGGACGWLAASPEANELAKVMSAAAGFDDRPLLGQNARAHLLQHFTRDRMAQEYETLFGELLA